MSIQNIPARFQRTPQHSDSHILLQYGSVHRHTDAVLLPNLLFLKCWTALSLSIPSERFCAKALSRSAYAFCFSSVNAFVFFPTSFLTASGKVFLTRSFAAFNLEFSFSMAAYFPLSRRLAILDFMLSVFSQSASRTRSSLSAISLSSSALRRCLSSFPACSFPVQFWFCPLLRR
mgnify:CR=1 FL=1